MKIDTIEILSRRNKFKYPCFEDWKIYDDVILAKHIHKVGCKAPYQQSKSVIHQCKSKHKMKEAILGLRTDDYGYYAPCKSLEKLTYRIEMETFEDRDLDWKKDGTFWIGIYLPQTLKEIEETRFV